MNHIASTRMLPVDKDGLVENLACRDEKSVSILVPGIKMVDYDSVNKSVRSKNI